MRPFFWGFFFLLLNFNLDLGGHRIGLLPSFVGYLLLWKAMRTLSGESERFRSAAPVAVAAACYAAPFYISDLLGFTFSGGWLPFLLAMLSTLLCLYVSWQVVAGFGELERASGRGLRYDSLRTAWILWAVFDLLTPAALLIPALSFAMLAAAAITSLCFLYLIYRATAE